jgi:AcrR family transcriptional regulator
LTVNRDREAFVSAAHGAEGEASSVPSGESGAEARGAGAATWPGEESDGRALRAQARREQRRSTILAAATRVFKEKGYHATSVNDIIDAAQIARGTFYLYFTSKREVFAELSATFLELIRASVRKISLDPADGEPLAQMRANFRRVMSMVLEHADLATVMLRSDAGDAEARAQLDVFYQQVIALIGQAVRVGHALGFARDCNVDVIAVAALAGLKEVLGRMLDARPHGSEIRGEIRGAGDDADDAVGAVDSGVAEKGAVDSGVVDSGVADEVEARNEIEGQGMAGTQQANGGPEQGGRSAGATQSGDPRGATGARVGGASPSSPWRMAPERLADELLTFFVRGVFTQ